MKGMDMRKGWQALILMGCGLVIGSPAHAVRYEFEWITPMIYLADGSDFTPPFKLLADDRVWSPGVTISREHYYNESSPFVPYDGVVFGSIDGAFQIATCEEVEGSVDSACDIAKEWIEGAYEIAFDLTFVGDNIVGYFFILADGETIEGGGSAALQVIERWASDYSNYICGPGNPEGDDVECTGTGRWVMVRPPGDIPEPGSLALLGLGLAGLGLSRRRKA